MITETFNLKMKIFFLAVYFAIGVNSNAQNHTIKVSDDIIEIHRDYYNNLDVVLIKNNSVNNAKKIKIPLEKDKDFVLSIKLKSKGLLFFVNRRGKNDKAMEIEILKDDNLRDREYELDSFSDKLLENYMYNLKPLNRLSGMFSGLKINDISNYNNLRKFIPDSGNKHVNLFSNNIFKDLLEQRFIVLHQTATKDLSKTIDAFDGPLKTGAHYIIEKDGQIYLFAPVYRVVRHAGGKYTNSVRNFNSIGIEHVNLPMYYPPIGPSTSKNFEKYLKDNFNSTPVFSKAMANLQNQSIKWLDSNKEGDKWCMYPDITFHQKRSTWLLIKRLEKELDIPDENLYPHEIIHPKKPGEGFAIFELIITRTYYEDKVSFLLNFIINNKNEFSQNEKDSIDVEFNTLRALRKETESALGNSQGNEINNEEENLIEAFYKDFYFRINWLESIFISHKLEFKKTLDIIQDRLSKFFDQRGYKK